MNKKNFWTLTATLLFSVTVYAGSILSVPVEIEYWEGGGSAYGDMSTARHSDNEFEHIGCGVRAYETGVGDEVMYYGFCQASVAEEEPVLCNTNNKGLLEVINSISDYAYISFYWREDAEGERTCEYIGSSTQSFYLPLNKDARKKN